MYTQRLSIDFTVGLLNLNGKRFRRFGAGK